MMNWNDLIILADLDTKKEKEREKANKEIELFGNQYSGAFLLDLDDVLSIMNKEK